MRKTYHLCVSYNEGTNVEHALRLLGVKEYTKTNRNTVNHGDLGFDYIVNLSKYELLYLRLRCSTGKMKNITGLLKETT